MARKRTNQTDLSRFFLGGTTFYFPKDITSGRAGALAEFGYSQPPVRFVFLAYLLVSKDFAVIGS